MAMPIESKKQSASKQAWMKENSKVFGVRVMKNTEADIWEYLQGKEASTIFKLALREYMENHKEEKMKIKEKRYRVKEEHIDKWFGNATGEEIEEAQNKGFTEWDIRQLANGWGVSVDELMEQVWEE